MQMQCKAYANATQMLSKCYTNAIQMLCKCYANAMQTLCIALLRMHHQGVPIISYLHVLAI